MTIRPDELIVDSFAGGGGTSTGIEMALEWMFQAGLLPARRHVDIAINHDAKAVAMHAANHPRTRHFCQSVWQVDPITATGGRPVGLFWASPDCKDHSKAKGGRPIQKNIRDLAWVVVSWAKQVSPRLIMLENVEEFADWSPLRQRRAPAASHLVDLLGRPLEEGEPIFDLHGEPVMERDPARKGETFRKFVRALKRLSYRVEYRNLRACDYGAPTMRKRLFMQCRRDGEAIVWPAPSHFDPRRADAEACLAAGMKPWRTAAECIDWSRPCPSIFLSREEGRAQGVNRPLVESTMARIAKGTWRYVITAARPFIVPVTHKGDHRNHSIDEPLRTITTARRGELAVVAPTLVATAHSKTTGRGPGTWSAEEPLRTVTRSADHAVAAAFLKPRYGERPGQQPRAIDIDRPMPTVVPTGNGADLVAAFLAQHNTGMVGHDARKPLSTIVARGGPQSLVAAHLLNMKGSQRQARSVEEPVPTLTAGGGHVAAVHAFLMKYYGQGGQWQDVATPLHTITTKDRIALVVVEGEVYEIVDIGMRMLTARERFNAQGFPPDYVIELQCDGRWLTGEDQGRMVGNSVCPPMACALFLAGFAPLASLNRDQEAA